LTYVLFAAALYGKGVYFAADSKYSLRYAPANADGRRFMFVAHVLTGDFCVGNVSYQAAPLKDKEKFEYRRFDSVVNSITDPKIFVVFNDTSSYPAYLITFQ